jgi:amino acid transporter
MSTDSKGHYGLRATCLSFPETLSQSVANISPTLTPAVIVPLVFASAGAATWLAYLFATIGLILVGTNINQFAKRSATPGSLYSYVTRGLGMNAGFMTGWCLILAYLLTASAVLAGSVNYAGLLLDALHWHTPPLVLFAAGSGLAWWTAYRDVNLSTRVMLILEVASMALILILGALVVRTHGSAVDPEQLNIRHIDWHGLKAGLILAFFSYVGFESATTLGEEARNPLRTIPRSVIMSAVISGLFFMITAYIAVLGFKSLPTSLGDSTAPFNDLSVNIGQPIFGILISVGAVISLFACTLASISAGARIIFTMGRHGIFHSHLAKAHSINDTPHHAVTTAALIVFLLPAILLYQGASVLDVFNNLSTVATYGFLVVYVAVSLAAPTYLKRIGKLTVSSIGISVLAIGCMIPPMISTVWPTPAAPLDKFPLYFAAYLMIGIGWYAWARLRTASTVAAGVARDQAIDYPSDHR